jgi:hypothetical protein
MGKVIFEFDSVEEQDDIRMVLDGYKWKTALWDIDQLLRSTVKHDVSILKHGEETSESEYQIVEKIREEIRRIMGDNQIMFD